MPQVGIRFRYIALLALVASAFGAYLSFHEGAAKSDSTQLEAPANAVVAKVGAFRRSAGASDSLPANVSISGTLIRSVGSDAPGAALWASVDNGRVCLQDEQGASVCTPVANFSDKPLIMSPGRITGSRIGSEGPAIPDTIEGLAPDGVTSITVVFADGSKESEAVVNNGFRLSAGKLPKTVSWTTADNATHSQEW